MSAHYVYRCYDENGGLLYVGCAKNVKRRMSSHKASRAMASRWLQVCMASYEVAAEYPDRATALAAEAAMIEAEQPLFNHQQRKVPWSFTRSDVAEYLIDHGHLALALETTCGCWTETKQAGRVDSWCRPHMVVSPELVIA